MKNYELTDETKEVLGHVLHRIRAIRDFGDIHKGDVGGWIESEKNLRGSAWVFDDAEVYGRALVFGNAHIRAKAKVYGNAKVCDRAKVYSDASVYGYAKVYGNAKVCDNAEIYGNAKVGGNAKVSGHAKVCGNAEIYGNAKVVSEADYAVFKNSWSSFRYFTYTRSNRKWMVGCFFGTGEELIVKAYKDSELSGKCYEIIVRAQEAIDAAFDNAENAEGETK